KSIFLQNLRVNKEKTSFQSSVLFRRTLYGTSHPYGKELDEDDVNRLAREELVDHFKNFFRQATLIVSGKVSDDQQHFITSAFSFLEYQTMTPADDVIPPRR